MSDIRVTSTGEIFYKVDSQIANMLMAALPTVFERVEQKPAAPAVDTGVVRFGVRKNPLTDRIELVMTQGSLVETFIGHSDLLAGGTFGGKAKRVPPQEIIDRYRAVWNEQNKANQRDEVAFLNRDRSGK